MPPALRVPVGLAMCAAACAIAPSHAVPAPQQAASAAASVDAEGPAALAALLARYDNEPAGAAKDQLAAQIDAVAHQKYATISRLYWYTEFGAAQTAARASHKPILHLRMLGRLDEELSCANSRLFRTTLYANQDVSGFLRDNFVLYWSSERPVPKITIDYGDGRKLERTITGNSAHYVMDADGHVLDVLPGVYAPAAFKQELTASLELADQVRDISDETRAARVADYHTKLQTKTRVRGVVDIDVAKLDVTNRTVSKAAVEVLDQERIVPETVPSRYTDTAITAQAARARALYGFDAKAKVLDDTSLALVKRLYEAAGATTVRQRVQMLNRLERSVLADTALNQLDLRPLISAEIVRRAGRADFDELNAFVYATVFLTPRDDAWLGLLPRTDFTGLPGDGVVMR